jgi:very-short-patch-repair endonuclease
VPDIQNYSKTLRKQLTDSERVLWRHLRAKQLNGLKFRRQEPIGSYVVDFVCYKKRLIIEIDGSQHAKEDNKENDIRRDNWFQHQGFQVLRFWNNDVLHNIQGVLEIIMKNDTPPSIPPARGGKKTCRSSSPSMEECFLCSSVDIRKGFESTARNHSSSSRWQFIKLYSKGKA